MKTISRIAAFFLLFGASGMAQSIEPNSPSGKATPASSAGNEKQLLEFIDKNSLHGALDALNGEKKELVWRLPGVDAPITLPLAHVGRVSFSTDKAEVKTHAMVKLIDGDWLAADVTEMRDGRLQLRLADGTTLAVDRAAVEWIYFSKGVAPDCYEGPVSMFGWVAQGGWTYRDGAFRATLPTQIGRNFEALPDRVEYSFEFDQGSWAPTGFNVVLHGVDAATPDPYGNNDLERLSVGDSTLDYGAMRNGRRPKIDLKTVLPPPEPAAAKNALERTAPSRWRIFEDRVAGRLVVFINGKKAGDFQTEKRKPGENRGAFSFQPVSYSPTIDQALRKIRIAPWDGVVPAEGAEEAALPKTDFVQLADDTTKEGTLESITADEIKIGGATLPRDQVVLLRLARPAQLPTKLPAVARVRLMERGEFSVAALNIQNGQVQARTTFGAEINLPVTAVRALEMPVTPFTPLPPAGTLVFTNGDRLRGSLEAAGTDQKVKWRIEGSAPLEVEAARLAGVVLAAQKDPPVAPEMLTRLGNGDLLRGKFGGLDRQNLLVEHRHAGQLTIPRAKVRSLYFGTEGKLPIIDGSVEHEVWEAGTDFGENATNLRKLRLPNGLLEPSVWSYLDGGYSVKKNLDRNTVYTGSFNFGRLLPDLPDKVDLSFDVSSQQKGQALFTAYLFTDPANLGYRLQFNEDGFILFDTNQQRLLTSEPMLERKYDDKIPADVTHRHVRILADRPAGRVTLFVNGEPAGSFGSVKGAPPRNLARSLSLVPNSRFETMVTISNILVAPWNGQLPGKAPAAAAPAQDTVLLANGDELPGTIGTSTAEGIQIEGEIGVLELPPNRLSMLEFGGRAPEAAKGVRLRLDDRTVLTVDSYRIENGTVICQNGLFREIRFPLTALRELIFPVPSAP